MIQQRTQDVQAGMQVFAILNYGASQFSPQGTIDRTVDSASSHVADAGDDIGIQYLEDVSGPSGLARRGPSCAVVRAAMTFGKFDGYFDQNGFMLSHT